MNLLKDRSITDKTAPKTLTMAFKRRFVGSVCTFYLESLGKRVAGKIHSVLWNGDENGIPDYLLKIEGRSGKVVEARLLKDRVFPCGSWKEADKRLREGER